MSGVVVLNQVPVTLYDSSGTEIGPATEATLATLSTEVTLEAARVLLASLDGKDFATETTQATLATEAKLEAVRALLASLDGKDFATQTTLEEARVLLASLDGKDFATQTTLATRASESTLEAARVLLASLDGKDFATQATLATRASEATLATRASEATLEAARLLLASLDGKDFATQTTLATRASEATLEAARVLLVSLDAKDFATATNQAAIAIILGAIETKVATEATLASIKDTDGIKKITDPLPAGTNEIGKVAQGTKGLGANAWPVALYDASGASISVQDGVAYPAGNDHFLVGGVHESDSKTYHARMRDDFVTPATKRIMVEAAIAPGSTIGTTSGATAGAGAVAERLLNGGSFDMVVNASAGSPDIFKFDALPVNDIQITSLRLVFSATFFDFNGDTFGKGGGDLPNGVSADIVSNNGAFSGQIAELFVNEDFLRLLDFSVSQAGSTDVMAASVPFSGNILLVGGSSDEISVTVQDNLTAGNRGISYFTATLYGVEIAP